MNAEQPAGTPSSDKSEEKVITPAGRLPKDRVSHVTPGQIIRRNDDGTYSIIERQTPNKPEENSSPKHQEK